MHISVEFDGKWMKAEVVAHVPAGIKVKFVDDGDIAVVPHLEVAARIKGNVGLGEGSSGGRKRTQTQPSWMLTKAPTMVDGKWSSYSSSYSAPSVELLEALSPKKEPAKPQKAAPAPAAVAKKEKATSKRKHGRAKKEAEEEAEEDEEDEESEEEEAPKKKRGRPQKGDDDGGKAGATGKSGKLGQFALPSRILSADKLEALLGRRVKKWFSESSEFFGGEVVHVDEFFKIKYDDGDVEDLTLDELIDIITPEEQD